MNGRQHGNWNAAVWLVAIAFALLGQFSMSAGQAAQKDLVFGVPRDGLIFFGAAAALFVGLVTIREREAAGAGAPSVQWLGPARDWATAHSTRIALVVASFGVVYVTARLLQNKAPGTSYWDAFGLWVLGGVLYVAAFVPATGMREAARAWAGRVRAGLAAQRVHVLLVVGVVLLAGVLRFVALGAIPDVVSGDEGRIGSLGLSAANGEILSPFITTYGHSTMYLFIEGGILKAFGANSPFALRFLHALAGTLTVLAVYLLGRTMFDERVGLVAACLMTVSHFHLHFSRIIVAGGIMDAFMTTVALGFFWYGLKHRRTLAFVAAGITVGLHVYLYMGGRLVFLFLLAFVAVLYVVKPKLARENSLNFLACLGGFVVLAVPMGLWANAHPEEFMARVNQVGIYESGWMAQEMARTGKSQFTILLEQFRDSMLVFDYYPAFGFYFARLPMLDFYTAAAFVPGLVYALWKSLEPRFLLLHAWFWSTLIGGEVLLMLAGQGAYRVLMLTPVVFLLAAVVLIKLADLGRQVIISDPRALRIVGVVFLAVTAYVNLSYYFGEYAHACKYEDGATRLVSHMGEYLGTLNPQRYAAYLLTGPTLPSAVIHPSWAFLSEQMPIRDVPNPIASRPDFVDPSRGAVFLFLPERFSDEAAVRQYYPNGTSTEFYDCGQLVGKAWTVAP